MPYLNSTYKTFILLLIIGFWGGFDSGYCLELTLEQAITQALQNNFDLRISHEKLNNAASEITKQKADFIPQLALEYTYTEQDDQPDGDDFKNDLQHYNASIIQKVPMGGELAVSYNTDLQSQSFYQAGFETERDEFSTSFQVTYTQHLMKDGLMRPAFVNTKIAEHDHQIQKIVLDDLQIELVNKVEAAFYQLLRLQKEISVNEELLKISDHVLALGRSRFEIGLIPEMDVIRAEIEKSQAREALLASRQLLEMAKKELQNLLSLDEPVKVIGKLDSVRPLMMVDEAIAIALKQNRQLWQIKKEIVKGELSVKAALAKVLPQVDLFASWKKTGVGKTYDESCGFDENEYQTGIKISYPFYNIGPYEAYRQEKRVLKKLKLRQSQMEIDISNRVAMIVKQLHYLENRIVVVRSQLGLIKKRLNLVLKAFNEGLIKMDHLFDARDDLLSAENLYLSIRLEHSRKWAALQALLGNKRQ